MQKNFSSVSQTVKTTFIKRSYVEAGMNAIQQLSSVKFCVCSLALLLLKAHLHENQVKDFLCCLVNQIAYTNVKR